MSGFIIIDTKLNTLVSKRVYKTRRAANNRADKLDQAYGAYRYQTTNLEFAPGWAAMLAK